MTMKSLSKNTPFRQCSVLMNRVLAPVLRTSSEYESLVCRLDEALLLADRVLVALRDSPSFGRTREVGERLSALAANDDPERAFGALSKVEIWLKGLLWLIDPERYDSLAEKDATRNTRKFNLFRAILELKLLTTVELDASTEEAPTAIPDPVRRLILTAKEDRNPHAHEPDDIPMDMRSRLLPETLAILVAPVLRHREALATRLEGLISAPLRSSAEIQTLLDTMASERRAHLEHFAGRERWIEDLVRRLRSDAEPEGSYLLLLAPEGTGKSALVSKLTEALASPLRPLGPDADAVGRVARWLPAALLHLGKKSADPEEIVESLRVQANALLVDPIAPLSPIDDETAADSGERVRLRKRSRVYEEAPGVIATSRTTDSIAKRSSARLRRLAFDILQRLCEERGHAILIIDALDEISRSGAGLWFLPEHLPTGVRVLLTSRPAPQLVSWIESCRRVERIRLEHFERREIPILLGTPDEGAPSREFNDRVFDLSQGWPLMVSHIARQVRAHDGQYERVELEKSADSVLESQAGEWNSSAAPGCPDPLEDALSLLAIFEPCLSLDLPLMQSYLKHRGSHVRSSDLRRLLTAVGSQIDGLDVGRVKLSISAFADYVRRRWLSPDDLRDDLEAVVDWIASDNDVPPSVVSRLLAGWAGNAVFEDDRAWGIIESVIERLGSAEAYSRLNEVARNLSGTDADDCLKPTVRRCLQTAADGGYDRARVNLGRLLAEEGEFEAGVTWLRRAADAGSPIGMRALGIQLVHGDGADEVLQEGVDWLRRAADSGDVLATRVLGSHLLSRAEARSAPALEGEELLRKAVEAGDATASWLLGERLLDGRSIDRDPTEGAALLRQSAEAGSSFAMHLLSMRLFSGDQLARDEADAVRWLRRSAESGDFGAMHDLAERLFDADGVAADPPEAVDWLQRAARAGDSASMQTLGLRLVHGDGVAKNAEEGVTWLQRAIAAGSQTARLSLATMLLDGDLLRHDAVEGEALLREGAAKHDSLVTVQLAACLIDGWGLRRCPQEGEALLREAADRGDFHAMAALGSRLVRGDGLTRDANEGLALLSAGAEAGVTVAMFEYGKLLYDGNVLPQDRLAGATLLRKAADEGLHCGAMAALGERLFDESGVHRDVVEGEHLLRTAAESGSARAMYQLARYIRSGSIAASHPSEAVDLFRRAVHEGDPEAVTDEAVDRFASGRAEDGFSLLEGLPSRIRDDMWAGVGVKLYTMGHRDVAARVLAHAVAEFPGSRGGARINLAYMARRGELPAGLETPSVEDLLSGPVGDGDPFAKMNYALELADDAIDDETWRQADALIASLSPEQSEELRGWWGPIADEGDVEGDLAIAWLVRHGLLPAASEASDEPSIEDRLARASTSWHIPEWFSNAPS